MAHNMLTLIDRDASEPKKRLLPLLGFGEGVVPEQRQASVVPVQDQTEQQTAVNIPDLRTS